MPRGMARHSRNSSYVRSIPEQDILPDSSPKNPRREKALYWHLDLYFASYNPKAPGTKLVKVDACEEEQCISTILSGATAALRKGRRRKRNDTITCSTVAKDGFARYENANPEDLVVFLRNEHVVSVTGFGSPVTSKITPRKEDLETHRYLLVRNDHTLRQTLDGRCLVEYPVLHVAFKDSKEAAQLAGASTGIFEKPDDTSDSSSSESESEDEEGDTASPSQIPFSPLPESAGLHLVKNAIYPGNGRVIGDDDEPLPKRRRADSPSSGGFNVGTSPMVNGSHDDDTSLHDITQDDVTTPDSRSTASLGSKPNGRPHSHGGKSSRQRISVLDNAKKLGVVETDMKSDTKKTLVAESKPTGSVVKEKDSLALDMVARRGSGLHLDHPFMKESVKVILETRIPRKPKTDAKGSVASGSAKGSAKLTASG